MAPVATEFEKIIHSARERKKNEALATKIFSSNRPFAPKAAPARGSLASRVGIAKPRPGPKANHAQSSSSSRRRPPAAGDVNGEWTHDLHDSSNPKAKAKSASLRSRITTSKPTSTKKHGARVSAALDLIQKQNDTNTNSNSRPDHKSRVRDERDQRDEGRPANISIRGLAGPFAVMAQNFAPGTTAADIESAMTPVGGEMVSCAVVKTQPIMLVEMVFYSREGGEKVIEMFHNKTADGRVIQVFAKPGGYQPPQPEPTYSNYGTGSYAASSYNREHDGRSARSNGYEDDLMAGDASDERLYSDRAVNKRGRGFQRR